jgi:tetratricopeptide (TPR) repeat protein
VRCRGLACVLLLLARSTPGQAAPAPVPADAGQDLTPTARALSDQALRQYQHGEFDAAIESFAAAYAMSNNPGLLFNVAQAYRLKGDCEHARDYYQRYLGAAPDTPFKPSLERRVAEMEACVANRGATAAPGGAKRASLDPATTLSPAPSTSPPALALQPPPVSPAKRAAVWTLRGSAAALLVGSAVFGALALDAREDAKHAPTMVRAYELGDQYRTDAAFAWTFVAAGLACAVISYLVGRP